jgi:uncharacterized delta-60 repeat protein
MKRHLVVFGAACAIALVLPGTAVADPGDLDPSFSENGKQTTDFDGALDYSYALAIQDDGRSVLGGQTGPLSGDTDFALARYTTPGELDSSFSGDGRRVLDFQGTGGDDFVYDLAVQPDGKIVAAGYTENPGGARVAFAVARFRPNGTLDPTFGGDGKVRTLFPEGPAYGYAVGIDSDGNVVVAGEVEIDPDSDPRDFDFGVARYHPNGTLDHSFGGDGLVTTDFDHGTDGGWDLAIQPNDRIVVAGWARPAEFYRFAVARYRTDGTRDGSFSGDGKLVMNFNPGVSVDNYALAVRLRPDGKIVVGGHISFSPAGGIIGLGRILPGGAPDPSFGDHGKIINDLGQGGGVYFEDMALQGDSRIVVTGELRGPSETWLFVARFWAGGGVDNTFGSSGLTRVKFGATADAEGEAVEIQDTAKILAAGSNGAGSDFASVRLLP